MKRFIPLLTALALAIPLAAQATITFKFDADGAGGLYTPIDINLIDQGVGNALSVGGSPNGGIQDGDITHLLYQANLDTFKLKNKIKFANGDNNIFFTTVAGVSEMAYNVAGSSASFAMASANVRSGDNFFYIYKVAIAGDDLAGTGFVGAVADRIMSGHISQVTGSTFTVTQPGFVNLDQSSGTNAWGNTQTLVGVGATNLVLTIDSVNAAYFPSVTPNTKITLGFVNTSLIDPFQQVDPSLRFSTDGIANGDHNTNVGAINGINNNPGSPLDFIFQADANMALDIPEPGSLALAGLALAGLGLLSRRRQAAK